MHLKRMIQHTYNLHGSLSLGIIVTFFRISFSLDFREFDLNHASVQLHKNEGEALLSLKRERALRLWGCWLKVTMEWNVPLPVMGCLSWDADRWI